MINDIKDVKAPVDLPDWGWAVWLALGFLLAAAAVFIFRWFSKRPPERTQPLAPPLPAWEKAYQALEALRRENLPDQGRFKEFFTRVADIARHYMEDRFQIHAPHMTTEEFLYYLGIAGYLNEAQKKALKDFLDSCDMVKFAKYAPTLTEAQHNFDLAKKLVDDTRV